MISIGIIMLLTGVILIACSYYIRNPENHSILTGWNKLSQEEKEKQGPRMAKDASLILNILGIIVILIGVVTLLNRLKPHVIDRNAVAYLLSFTFLFIGYFLLRRRNYISGKSRLLLTILGIIFVLGTVFFIYSFSNAIKNPSVTIDKQKFIIHSVNGVEGKLEDIVEVKLLYSKLKVLKRIDGFRTNDTYKGEFLLDSNKRVRLYVVNSKLPILYIESKKLGKIYINNPDSSLTVKYFTDLKKIISNEICN